MTKMEIDFSERINYSSEVWSKKKPKDLQQYFEIGTKLSINELKYITKAKNKEAFNKYPYSIKFIMNFDSVEEKKKFTKSGFEELQKQANSSQKPVKIPHIVSAKDYLGEYDFPTSIFKNVDMKKCGFYIFPDEKLPQFI